MSEARKLVKFLGHNLVQMVKTDFGDDIDWKERKKMHKNWSENLEDWIKKVLACLKI